jgi:ABC-type bacteriocin/lantibiotic exporter with double-glycine peptidase domain
MNDLIKTLNQLQQNINQTQVALQKVIDLLNEDAATESVPEVLPYVTTEDLRAKAYVHS